MVKIALLSFHNAYNYGASLQAYALQHALEEMGAKCEYIDYLNEARENAYDMGYQLKDAVRKHDPGRIVRTVVGTPYILSRGKKFKAFYDKYLHKTDRVYHNSQEAKALNSMYDKFIVGSDQVWNTKNNGGDTAYLLDFVEDNTKKISYSSSFGMERVPEPYLEDYRKCLMTIDRLAVREVAGVKIVRELTGRTAHLVLDPVFLLDRESWSRLKSQSDQDGKKHLFFYLNKPSQISEFYRIGYQNKEAKTHILSSYVTPMDFLNPSVKVRVSMSPTEFLEEIATAELVVTASFHCLAFAILFHKPFVVILAGDKGKDERLINLLKITDLESRILTSDMTSARINSPIDYDKVDRLLQPYLEYSREYLRRAAYSEPDLPVTDAVEDNSMEKKA